MKKDLLHCVIIGLLLLLTTSCNRADSDNITIEMYSTTAFQTSDVRFLVNTSVHSAGRTTGNEEPESFSLG